MKSPVFLLVRSFQGGGAERVMVNLANGLARRGHRVVLAAADVTGPYRSEISPQVEVLDFKSKTMGAAGAKLRSALRSLKPDVGLATTTNVNFQLLLSKMMTGYPRRVFVRESGFPSIQILQKKGLAARFMELVVKGLYPHAAGVIVPALAMKHDLVTNFGIKDSKVTVLPSPVVTPDLEEKCSQPCPHPWVQDKKNPVILCAGRLQKPKDFQTVLKAVALVKHIQPLKVIILGQGPEEGELKQLAHDLGIGDAVDLPGFIPNPFPFFKNADLYVLSSLNEGLPNTLIQALAVGTPVVSVDCISGPREILENGKYGPLVAVGDAQALSQAILNTLKSPLASGELKKRSQFWSESVIIDSCEQLMGLQN